MPDLAARIHDRLQYVAILPRRLQIVAPGLSDVSVSTLRGVWGAALHDLDPTAYRAVFDPPSTGSDRGAAGYVLRPAASTTGLAVEWSLIGNAIRHDANLRRAWDVASGMGLGQHRQRFLVQSMQVLNSDGVPSDDNRAWALDRCTWPPMGRPTEPCRLVFPRPLRLMHKPRGACSSVLNSNPSLADIVVAAFRRIHAFLPSDHRASWAVLKAPTVQLAHSIPTGRTSWRRCDLHRYSGRQKADLQLRGISGSLELSEGPGELWPILAAARWLHVGKGATVGMGQMLIERP